MKKKYTYKMALNQAGKTGLDIGFKPAFVAALVTFLITNDPFLHSDSFGSLLQLVEITIGALVVAFVASLIVALAAFISYNLETV
jgi:hypothetical protein